MEHIYSISNQEQKTQVVRAGNEVSFPFSHIVSCAYKNMTLFQNGRKQNLQITKERGNRIKNILVGGDECVYFNYIWVRDNQVIAVDADAIYEWDL